MKFLKYILGIVLGFVGVFIIFLAYISLSDYKPEEKIQLIVENNSDRLIGYSNQYRIGTYNIGYGGLDKDQDFFADGGTKSRAESLDKVNENLSGIKENLGQINPDILLIQEMDIKSSRSYGINQLDFIKDIYPDFTYVLGLNYKVPWVPVPVTRPMGKTESGIATFSRFTIDKSSRYDLPGKEKWPVQLFELDRCFTESRLPIDEGGDLLIINLHLSAFDSGGLIRQKQLAYLKEYLANEYKAGNHIIVGGDWNHNLPGTNPYDFPAQEEWPFWLQDLPEDFVLEGFNWVIQSHSPTVRTLAQEYKEGYNFLAIIDGFLVSDNVQVVGIGVIDDMFVHSDHNPVYIDFILTKE